MTTRPLVRIDEEKLAWTKEHDPETYREVIETLAELDHLQETDPLQFLRPFDKQLPFLTASTPIQAAFAGNRFGKTTILTGKSYVQHYPEEVIPAALKPWKTAKSDVVCGRLLCPSFKVLEGVNLPTLRKWAPRHLLLGGSFDKAWDKQNRVLRFQDGGFLEVFTYEQDADKMGGASLDYVAYDEPPPKEIREECRWRLIDRDGFEMFALTPVNMSGGGIGWLYRDIWKRREAPHITVVQGSIHDNLTLPKAKIKQTLDEYGSEDDPLRRSREFGEFVHLGGMIYPGGFEQRLVDPPKPEQLQGQDIVVGIDPGLKNAAFVWVAFDSDQRAFVFDEQLLRERTPADYATALNRTNEKWGIQMPTYVIDPSARNRSLTNAESVEAELNRLGIYCVHGQNPVEAGVQQVRRRLQHEMLFVSRECRGLRGEAEEYRMEDRPDGEFKVVKENDHRLDALRYVCQYLPWELEQAQEEQEQPLGWVPGTAPPQSRFGAERDRAPMGSMS